MSVNTSAGILHLQYVASYGYTEFGLPHIAAMMTRLGVLVDDNFPLGAYETTVKNLIKFVPEHLGRITRVEFFRSSHPTDHHLELVGAVLFVDEQPLIHLVDATLGNADPTRASYSRMILEALGVQGISFDDITRAIGHDLYVGQPYVIVVQQDGERDWSWTRVI